MNSDLLTPNVNPAKYIDAIPAFEDFDERNNDCDECPFYGAECSGDGDKRCLSADVLELLKRGRNLEMDAEPVRHGRWIRQDDTYVRFKCSVCKSRNHSTEWPYCCLCGAKMDGGAE